MTRNEVGKLLARLQDIYFMNFGANNSNQQTRIVDAWTAILAPYPTNIIVKGLEVYTRTNTSGFAPTPAQLINAAYEACHTDLPEEGETWSKIMAAIRNSGYYSKEQYEKLPEIAKSFVGSADQLRIWALEEHFNPDVVKSLFSRHYNAYKNEIKQKALVSGMQGLTLECDHAKMIEEKGEHQNDG